MTPSYVMHVAPENQIAETKEISARCRVFVWFLLPWRDRTKSNSDGRETK